MGMTSDYQSLTILMESLLVTFSASAFGIDVAAFDYPVYFREGFCFFFVLILHSIT